MDIKRKDIVDEALKILYLEKADLFNDQDVDSEIIKIKTSRVVISDEKAKKSQLLSKLSDVLATESLGQTISNQLTELKLSVEQLAKSTLVPVEVVEALIKDDIYTNNVPIQLFKRLSEELKISFITIEQSIKKTLQLLAEKSQPTDLTPQPAFRKGFYHSRNASGHSSKKTDGRELYENAESMEKYIARLKELMS